MIVEKLTKKLGAPKVLTGSDLKERYTHIWRMNQPLKALVVVLPTTTEEVAEILKICHAHDQPVIVHGGLTNLVGSTETTSGQEVIISMEKMNAIEEVDPQSRTMTVQAGAILENVQGAAKAKNLLFPLNYGAKGSAQIGGAISTNAGGLQVLRFGMTRNLVLGLEVVLADGTILSSLKKIIKDNSGYDLKQLFIGSEGTLGVVTKAVLKLVEHPKSRSSAWVGIASYEKVMQFLKYMDGGLAGTLSGYELFWQETFIKATTPPASVKSPLPYEYAYYVLLESLGSDPEKDQATLEKLLAQALEEGLIADAAVAYTESDLTWLWTIREDVSIFNGPAPYNQHFDISLSIPDIGNYVSETIEKLKVIPAVASAVAFGHVADGNIHFIVSKDNASAALTKQINEVVYQPLTALKGSVSAEHGIGLDKRAYLPLCRTPTEIQLMRTLKGAMDPKGILNRGKILQS
ncbi:MAG: FAD-binding oxidoreductase [Bacteroidota bacterium]